MTHDELVYLAGIIDGEGCISIYTMRKRHHVLQLRIANTDPRLMLWLQDRLGGGITTRAATSRWKARHVWTLGPRQTEEVLRNVEPYLVLKRDQAELALAFRELTSKRHVEREQLKQRLHVLNRRGHVA